MATRIEESFFLRKATSTRIVPGTTSVAGTMVAAVVGERLQAVRQANKQQAGIRVVVEKLAARRERDAGAVVAPAVNSQCDHGRLLSVGPKAEK